MTTFASETTVHVLFFGVRGSSCAPGMAFVRYGANTSCVALAHGGGPASLVLDAGTGTRNLSRHLGGRPFRGTILLGHLHWGHTQGLPFFAAGNAEQVLDRAFSPPLSRHAPPAPRPMAGQVAGAG